jgi:hypothetical protein
MDISDLLHAFCGRAPWQSVARPVLRTAGVSIHQGPENTISRVLSGDSPDADWNLVQKSLVEHLSSAEKVVKIVKLRAGEKHKLLEWMKTQRKQKSPLTDAYPGVTTRSELVPYQNQEPQAIGWIPLQVGTAALFTAARAFLTRIALPASSLKDGVADGYESLYGIKRTFTQTYDVVWLPASGEFVCILVDLPKGSPNSFANASLLWLSAQVRRVLNRPMEFVNLWPAIEGLYRSKEGKLVDYGFVVEGKAVNHHKARKLSESLREARYDKAGADSVGDEMEIFKIAIEWARVQAGFPAMSIEALLPGTALQLSGLTPPVLEQFIVRDNLTSGDLDFVVSKILNHIP